MVSLWSKLFQAPAATLMASHRHRVFRMMAFVIIFLNYLQTFEGVLMMLYSSWMLSRWNSQLPVPPPPSSAPTDMLSDLTGAFDSLKLPAPWFIYSFAGFGVVMCFVSFAGCLAVSSRRRWGLCFYELLVVTLLSTEAVIVTYIRVDEQWAQNLPYDPTGQIDSISSFIKTHAHVCKRIGVSTIMVQVLSLLLTFIMRILVILWAVTVNVDHDCEKIGGKTIEPLLNHHHHPKSGCQTSNNDLSDILSSFMKDKYGSNKGEKYTLLIQNPAAAGGTEDMKTTKG